MPIVKRSKVILFTFIGFLLPTAAFADSSSAEKCVLLLYDYTPPVQMMYTPEAIEMYYGLSRVGKYELKESLKDYSLFREIGQTIAASVRTQLNKAGAKRDQKIAETNSTWEVAQPFELNVNGTTSASRSRFLREQLRRAETENLISRVTQSRAKLNVELLLHRISFDDLGTLLLDYVADYKRMLDSKKIDFTILAKATEWSEAPQFMRAMHEMIRRSRETSVERNAQLDKIFHMIYGSNSEAVSTSTANPSPSFRGEKTPYIGESLGTKIVQEFAERRSPYVERLIEIHLAHLNPKKHLEEKHSLFINAGLNIDNPLVIRALTRLGSSIFNTPSSMASTAVLRVNGQLIFPKTLERYYFMKAQILMKKNMGARNEEEAYEAYSQILRVMRTLEKLDQFGIR